MGLLTGTTAISEKIQVENIITGGDVPPGRLLYTVVLASRAQINIYILKITVVSNTIMSLRFYQERCSTTRQAFDGIHISPPPKAYYAEFK